MREDRVLVTGGQGFIGKLLTARLERRGVSVHAARFDVGDAVAVREAFRFEPNVVVHLASPTDVEACAKDPAMAERAMILGTQHVLEGLGAKTRLVFASSMMVYAEPSHGVVVLDETSETLPSTVYGRCKLEAERLVSAWTEGTSRSAYVLRIFAHTHQSQRGSRFLSRMKQRIEAIPVGATLSLDRGLLDQARDIGAASDLVEAIDTCVQTPGADVFNVCSSRARTLGRLAEIMAHALGRSVRFEGETSAAPSSVRGSGGKIADALGFAPRIQTDEELIAYYLSASADG